MKNLILNKKKPCQFMTGTKQKTNTMNKHYLKRTSANYT